MNLFSRLYNINFPAISIVALIVLASCTSVEEITIDRDANFAGNDERKNQPLTVYKPDSVRVITVGELGRAHLPDPANTMSNSMHRLNALIYQGLTDVDEDGKIVPALASAWSISDDKRTYTFQLDSTASYHDSNAFLNGVGRNVRASDVLFSFKRSASLLTPSITHRMLWNIKGYQNFYYNERLPKSIKDQNIDIEGLKALTKNTLRIRLIEPDSLFLTKLAHPGLSVYPPDVIDSNTERFTHPVGSDAFRFTDMVADSIIILQQVPPEDDASTSDLQLRFYFSKHEPKMYKFLAAGEFDALNNAGPMITNELFDTSLSLKAGYQDLYTVNQSQASQTWTVMAGEESAGAIKQLLSSSAVKDRLKHSPYIMNFTLSDTVPPLKNPSTSDTLNIQFYDDISGHFFLNTLASASELTTVLRFHKQPYLTSDQDAGILKSSWDLAGSDGFIKMAEFNTPSLYLSTKKRWKMPIFKAGTYTWWMKLNQLPAN